MIRLNASENNGDFRVWIEPQAIDASFSVEHDLSNTIYNSRRIELQGVSREAAKRILDGEVSLQPYVSFDNNGIAKIGEYTQYFSAYMRINEPKPANPAETRVLILPVTEFKIEEISDIPLAA